MQRSAMDWHEKCVELRRSGMNSTYGPAPCLKINKKSLRIKLSREVKRQQKIVEGNKKQVRGNY